MSHAIELLPAPVWAGSPRPTPADRVRSNWLRDHARTLVLTLWVVVAVAVGVKAAASPARHSVWPIFAGGSGHFWAGQPLYKRYPNLDLYRYSPTFAVAVTPFAALPMRVGGCLWGLFSVGVLFGGVRALVRDGLPPLPTPWAEDVVLGAAAVAAGTLTWNLQSNALVLALVAYGAAAVARRRWWAAAGFLTAPVFVKVWPVAVVMLFAACWPRQLIVRVIVCAAGLAALPFVVAPDVAAHRYACWWKMMNRTQGDRWPGFRDALTVWELTGRPADPTAYHALQAAGAAVCLAACLAARRAGGPPAALAVGLTAWACWQLVLGPASEQCTYGLAIPLVAWWAAAGRGGWAWVTLGLLLLFSIGDVERVVIRWLPEARAVLPAVVATFAGYLAVRGWAVLSDLSGWGAVTETLPMNRPVALIPR